MLAIRYNSVDKPYTRFILPYSILLLGFLAWASPEIAIKQWPLPNENRRKELTLLYLKKHSAGHPLTGDLEKDVRMTPKVIVIHWTGGSSAKSTWNYFSRPSLRGRKNLKKAGALNVSAHFLVARNGTIYQLLDDNRIARHCIGLNHLSIGIENVGNGDKYKLTTKQLKANARLITYLANKHPITHVIGHKEYRKLEDHPYFSENDPNYRTAKSDPGDRFMKDLRKAIADLGLSGPPAKKP